MSVYWIFYTFWFAHSYPPHQCLVNMIILWIGDFHVSSNHFMLSIALATTMYAAAFFFIPTFALILLIYPLGDFFQHLCVTLMMNSIHFFASLGAPVHSIYCKLCFLLLFVSIAFIDRHNCACIPKFKHAHKYTDIRTQTHFKIIYTFYYEFSSCCAASVTNKLISEHLFFIYIYIYGFQIEQLIDF